MLPFRPLVAKATTPLAGTLVQSNSRIVKQRRHHHTDTEWEDQKQTIFRLYIEEDRNAEDVIEILARDFAFKARYYLSNHSVSSQRC
jgi:Clr5 domain